MRLNLKAEKERKPAVTYSLAQIPAALLLLLSHFSRV